MKILLVVPYYISWHYSRGITNFLLHWKDFLWFAWNFFSIGLLLKTLFTPFQRLGQKAKSFDPEKILEALATTLMMRLVGAIVRSFFIIIGVASLLAILVFGAVFFIAWVLIPFVLLTMLITGVIALFS